MAHKTLALHIYPTRRHIFFTVSLVVLPFVSLLLFSWFAHIPVRHLFGDVLLSSYRLAIAYVFAAVLGWGLAVLVVRERFAAVGLPLFDVLQSFPTFAALPLAVYVWGVSDLTIIVFLIITIIWPIFFSVVSSLKLVRHDWQEATEIFGLRGFFYVRRFIVPVSLPGLITGSIVGLGEGWEALVATEIIVGAPRGLGAFFQGYQHSALLTALGIFCLLTIIFVINKFVWLSLLEWSHRTLAEG